MYSHEKFGPYVWREENIGGKTIYVADNVSPKAHFKYADDKNIHMSFEGALLEYFESQPAYDNKFMEFLEERGYTYVLGDEWNCKIEIGYAGGKNGK